MIKAYRYNNLLGLSLFNKYDSFLYIMSLILLSLINSNSLDHNECSIDSGMSHRWLIMDHLNQSFSAFFFI